MAHDMTRGFGDAEGFKTLQYLASGKFHGLPMPFLILALVATILWVVLHRSVYGRYLFAVGRNEEATRFSGVNTRRVVAGTYVLAGLLTGISGILFAFYTRIQCSLFELARGIFMNCMVSRRRCSAAGRLQRRGRLHCRHPDWHGELLVFENFLNRFWALILRLLNFAVTGRGCAGWGCWLTRSSNRAPPSRTRANRSKRRRWGGAAEGIGAIGWLMI